jgi:pimeloyl-ACP methyl ester carboxylesterase
MSETVELNGNQFFLRTWGMPSNPVLLLHGFPEYSGAWEELGERLKHTFYCVAPDQRGYGQSYSPPEVEAYKMRYLVGDLRALITHFGGPVFVLGHDWGAAAAYGLTIAHPELVKNL